MSSVTTDSAPQQLTHRSNLKVTLFTLVLLPLLVGMGFWQLARAEQKRELQAAHEAHQAQVAVELKASNLDDFTPFSRIIAEGSFDHAHTWLIDNQHRHGKLGFEVVQPFTLKSGGTFLINRGWIAGLKLRNELPVVPEVKGMTTIFAEVMTPSLHPMLSAESTTGAWPKIITTLTPEVMAKYLDREIPSNYVRLDEASVGVLEAGWYVVATTEAKHLGYAIQWFAMAIALVICFMVMNTNIVAWLQAKKN